MMVKYLLVAAALVASLGVTELAEARGRRGCSSCSAGGGCPGGVCAVPAAPGKMAATDNAPPALAATETPAPAAALTASQPAPNYATNNARRGRFGSRR